MKKKQLPLNKVVCGNCRKVVHDWPKDSVDAIVTDPPAGISFMGKAWDHDKGGRDRWIAWMEKIAAGCLRVLKPGGYAFVWSIPRTAHWVAMAWENAGFEVRDKCYHIFGSGFPKSLDVGKAIDKAAGKKRKVVGIRHERRANAIYGGGHGTNTMTMETLPASTAAKIWQGWGTGMKPAIEEWHLFRKPPEGTIAANVQKYGTGALNIDGCRIPLNGDYKCGANGRPSQTGLGDNYNPSKANRHSEVGRWPANLILDGSEEVLKLFPSSETHPRKQTGRPIYGGCTMNASITGDTTDRGFMDSGSAARFYYCAKPSKAERNKGCTIKTKNSHPTVKPLALMRYLCKLVTPPGGIICDPFCGSGSTLIAAKKEGFKYIGIDKEHAYCTIAEHRLLAAKCNRRKALL